MPPGYQSLTFFNTTFGTLLSTQATLTPTSVPGGSPDYPNPSTYNWSFGVQQDLGKGSSPILHMWAMRRITSSAAAIMTGTQWLRTPLGRRMAA